MEVGNQQQRRTPHKHAQGFLEETRVQLAHLSEETLHLQTPGCRVARMDLVERLKDLVGWRAGPHHVGSLKRGEAETVIHAVSCLEVFFRV